MASPHLRCACAYLAGALLAVACGAARAAEEAPVRPGQIGGILREYWTDLPGSEVKVLTGAANFPLHPDAVEFPNCFEGTPNWGENYGSLMRGWVHPPVTGNYVFWIASDDQSELWLSTSERTGAAVRIAWLNGSAESCQWNRDPSQQSQPVRLEAGRKYYVEAVHKQGGGADFLAVGWQLPDGTQERPIPGNRVSPCEPMSVKPPVPPELKLLTPIPQKPGHHKLKAVITFGKQVVNLPFLLYLPENYDKTTDLRPLLIFLHGGGEQGVDLNGVMALGPAPELQNRADFRKAYPFIGLSPQASGEVNWYSRNTLRAILALLDELTKQLRVDQDRVYCTGLSFGGTGTWKLALEAPERFAAIAPIAGRAVQPESAGQRLQDVHTWIITGGADGDYTVGAQQMTEALRKANAPVKLTVVPGEGHGSWGRYYPDIRFYEWLLQWRRAPPPPPKEEVTAAATATPPAPEPTLRTNPSRYLIPATLVLGAALLLWAGYLLLVEERTERE